MKNNRKYLCEVEFNKRIYMPKGKKKKAILYNLCTASLLRYGKELLHKLERNYQVFEDSKEDIFVIFAIQTGLEDKINLVREDILEEYRSVLCKYESADFCIVIDSEEMDDVYDLCDAFYGDWGIGAWRCRLMEKPVMIQSAQVE
ncbi:hypothetical protein [Butyrivibrio sp. FC2001]|uniref:hypothetical protein n=1 Tax=Butyrivibrio sp. FC2001 TaxID=1280671 RepID=UPI0004213EF0|nr:hypothetical protein [Butyrivibrio sp. FC2001]